MKHLALIGSALWSLGCSSEAVPELDSPEVESAARHFYELISAYDYAGIRAASSPDFEILEAGLRMDIDGFVSMLQGMEARSMELEFEAAEFNTEVSGDVAYTTNLLMSAGGLSYLDGFILRRTDSGWLVDRAFSMPAVDIEP